MLCTPQGDFLASFLLHVQGDVRASTLQVQNQRGRHENESLWAILHVAWHRCTKAPPTLARSTHRNRAERCKGRFAMVRFPNHNASILVLPGASASSLCNGLSDLVMMMRYHLSRVAAREFHVVITRRMSVPLPVLRTSHLPFPHMACALRSPEICTCRS